MSSTAVVATQVNFISVLKPPVTAGEITFSLQSFDAANPYDSSQSSVDLTLTVTVCGTEDEIGLAKAIESQLTSQLTNYAYSGTPVFSSQPVPATYRVSRSDHVVSVWSQAAMELSISSDTSKTFTVIDPHCPDLCTIQFFKDYAQVLTLDLTDENDDEFTDVQLEMIINQFSQEIINRLGSFVVLCTYLNSYIGNDEKFIFTSPTPGYSRDSLVVRHKSRGFTTEESSGISDNIIPYPTSLFQWVKSSGKLNYRPRDTFVNLYLPWRRDNEVYITIIAGYKFIPKAIQRAIVRLHALDSSGEITFKEIKAGDWSATTDNSQLLNYIYKSIKDYRSYDHE